MNKNCLAKFIELDYSKVAYWLKMYPAEFTDLVLEKTSNEVACKALDEYDLESYPFIQPEYDCDHQTYDQWDKATGEITGLILDVIKNYIMSLPSDSDIVLELAQYVIYGYDGYDSFEARLDELFFNKIYKAINTHDNYLFVQKAWEIAYQCPVFEGSEIFSIAY